MKRHYALTLIILAIISLPVYAGIGEDLMLFFKSAGMASNVTTPGSYQDQAAGFYTGGSIVTRNAVRNAQIATVQMPGFRAGCGGIDLWMGGFSHIKSDQLVEMLRNIGSAAASYAFMLAMQTVSPQIYNILNEINNLASQINQTNINTCEVAATAVGGMWPKSDQANKHLCQSMGANKGVTAEQSKAIHKAAQLISGVDHDNQLYTDKAANISGSAGIGTGKGGGIFNGSLGMQTSVTASDQDILRAVEKFSTDENFQKAYRDAVQASVNVSHNVSNETAKRLSDGVAGSFEQSMSERAEAAKSFQESNAWSQQAMNTRTNAAAINANYNQQFVEWLAERPADNAQGKIGYRGAANIIATHPQEAIAWGNQFMKDMGLTPSISLSTNPNQLKTDYHNETGHQVYRATKDSLESVRQQGASELPSAATIQQKGEELVREETASFINTNNDFIDTSSSQVSGQGSQMQKKVKSQQGRYVTGRALEKVGQETKDTLKDMFDMNGEPQQK